MQSKQTKPAGPRYCVFIFCDENTSHSVLFCSFFKNLSDGLNELPGLQSGSIIAPCDQRRPLSSAENFKTSNNKHFEQSAEPPPGPKDFIFLPSLSHNTPAIRLRVKIQTFYLLLCRTFHHGNKPRSCLLVSPNGKKERKKSCPFLLFHLAHNVTSGWDLTSVSEGRVRCGSQLAGEAAPPASHPSPFPTSSAETDGERYMKRPREEGGGAREGAAG